MILVRMAHPLHTTRSSLVGPTADPRVLGAAYAYAWSWRFS